MAEATRFCPRSGRFFAEALTRPAVPRPAQTRLKEATEATRLAADVRPLSLPLALTAAAPPHAAGHTLPFSAQRFNTPCL